MKISLINSSFDIYFIFLTISLPCLCSTSSEKVTNSLSSETYDLLLATKEDVYCWFKHKDKFFHSSSLESGGCRIVCSFWASSSLVHFQNYYNALETFEYPMKNNVSCGTDAYCREGKCIHEDDMLGRAQLTIYDGYFPGADYWSASDAYIVVYADVYPVIGSDESYRKDIGQTPTIHDNNSPYFGSVFLSPFSYKRGCFLLNVIDWDTSPNNEIYQYGKGEPENLSSMYNLYDKDEDRFCWTKHETRLLFSAHSPSTCQIECSFFTSSSAQYHNYYDFIENFNYNTNAGSSCGVDSLCCEGKCAHIGDILGTANLTLKEGYFPDEDVFSPSDSYIEVYVRSKLSGFKRIGTTEIIINQNRPKFGQTFSVRNVSGDGQFLLGIYDNDSPDRKKDQFIGRIKLGFNSCNATCIKMFKKYWLMYSVNWSPELQ